MSCYTSISRTRQRSEQRLGIGDRKLDDGESRAVTFNVPVGHAWGVESPAGISLAIEKYQAAGRMRPLSQNFYSLLCRLHGRGVCNVAKKIRCGFGHEDFHDGLAIAGAGHGASLGVGITSASD